jgi:hypothetical protein
VIALTLAAAAAPSIGIAAELTAAGHSNANPSIAATGRFVAITWGATAEGATDIYAAVSRDGGKSFGPPVAVNDAAAKANLSGEQPPRVSLVQRAGRDPSIVVVWTSKAASGTRLLSARSDDSGKSFGRAAQVPGSDAAGNRGWESTATDASGRVVAVWLDHRELAPPPGTVMNHAEHQHAAQSSAPKPDGAVRAQRSKIYFAGLGDAESAVPLTGGVCYCCKTAIATGGKGMIYAAWRHVYPGNIRDIAFSMSKDGGRTFAPPARVSEDNWVIDGCPENGPSVAVDATGRIHILWPTRVMSTTTPGEATLALFYATSREGQRFTPRQRLPTEGVARHPQLILGPRGTVIATWEEQERGSRRIALARGASGAGDAVTFERQIISDAAPAVYPVIASTADGLVAAWTSGTPGKTTIRTAQLSH